MPSLAPFSPGNTISLSCTTASAAASINLPAGQQLVLTSLGPDLAYIAWGATATAAGFPILPGTQITVTMPADVAQLAAICPTSTATLKLSSGDGILNGIGAATTGSGGGLTDNVNITEIAGTAVGINNPLPVEVLDGAPAADGSGNITTGTGVVTAANTDGYSTVTFSVSGTYAGFTGVFEQSDNSGSTWYPVDAYRIGTGLVEQGANNLTNAAVNWRATTSGSDSFRIRATALTSGTVAVLMSFSAMPSGAGVGVTTNFVDNRPAAGTITIQDTGSSTASGQNSASLITGTPTVNSTFALALNGYSGFYALVTGTWTGTVQFEKSIDGGTTWTPFSVHIDSTAYTQVAITANCSVRSAGAGATNVRLRATAAMTGTVNVQFVFASADTVVTLTNAARLFDNTTGAAATIKPASTAAVATDTSVVVAVNPNTSVVAVGAAASAGTNTGNPVKVSGAYNTSPPGVTNGQVSDLQVDANGNLRVVLTSTSATGVDGLSNASLGSIYGSGIQTATFRPLPIADSTYNGTTWDRLRSVITGTDSVGTGITAAGLVAQFDDVAPSTVTENQFGNLRMAADRSLLTSIQNTYAHISTATTTTVKSGAGTLAKIIVNTLGTVASTCTVYDNTAGSGTVIAVINTLALGGAFEYDVKFTTGLTIVTTGTAAPDITVSYK